MPNLNEYISRAVAAAPQPTPEQVKELGRLLAPALLRTADVQARGVAA